MTREREPWFAALRAVRRCAWLAVVVLGYVAAWLAYLVLGSLLGYGDPDDV